MRAYVVARADGSDIEYLAVCESKDAVNLVIERELHRWADDHEEFEAAVYRAREELELRSYDTRWESGVGSWDFDVQDVQFIK